MPRTRAELKAELHAEAERLWSGPGSVDTFRIETKEFTLPRTHSPYPPEFRQQMVERPIVTTVDARMGGPSSSAKSWPASAGRISSSAWNARSWHIIPMSFGNGRRLVRAGDRLDPRRVFEFASANQADYPAATMCRVLGVSAGACPTLSAKTG